MQIEFMTLFLVRTTKIDLEIFLNLIYFSEKKVIPRTLLCLPNTNTTLAVLFKYVKGIIRVDLILECN